jgi:hypothetical protein
MRRVKALVAAMLAAVVCFASVARADEVVVRERPSRAGTVARDVVGGVLLGSAVAGGIILYQTQVNDRSDYDWQRTLGYGALIGLGVGLVWGVIDATTGPSYAMTRPVHDGQALTLDLRRNDQSGKEMFPLVSERF